MLAVVHISISLLILLGIAKMASALENLRAQVERNTTVTESAITLLKGLKDKLDDAIASGDLGAVESLAETLGRETDALANAVTTNTPSTNVPPPEQPPNTAPSFDEKIENDLREVEDGEDGEDANKAKGKRA